MKKINVSSLILEELIRVRLNEQGLDQYDVEDETPKKQTVKTDQDKTKVKKQTVKKDLNKTKVKKQTVTTDTITKPKLDPNRDEDDWDTTPIFNAKLVAKKLYDYKGSFFGGQDYEQAYANFIVKNISTATDWDKTDKELKKLSGGKGIISYGRSFINDDETSVWNPILTHVKKIYPKRVAEFVGYLGTDTYKKFLSKTAQDAKSIAQEIYDSKRLTYDNEAQLIAAIKKIPNAAAWQATDKQLQVLSGEKGIFSYIRSFVRDNDTQTWTPILTHIAKKRLVSNDMLKLYVQYLGGPTMYPNILSNEDAEKSIEDAIQEIEAEDEQNGNTIGGDTAIQWGLGILAGAGFLGKMFGLAGTTGIIWLIIKAIKKYVDKRKTNSAAAAGREVAQLDLTRPNLIKRQLLKLEEFITRGILGNSGALRRMIRRLERQGLITATEAREAIVFINNNRYAIASQVRKTYMKEIIKAYMVRGFESAERDESIIRNIINAIPLEGPTGDAMRRRYGELLRRAAEQRRRSILPPPPPPRRVGY